jgi:hypothetical protein
MRARASVSDWRVVAMSSSISASRAGGIGTPCHGSEAGEPSVVLATGVGQGTPSLLAHTAGGIGSRPQRGVLGVGVFGGAARGDVEGRLQRRSVIELAGDLRDPAGSGGQVR